MNIHKNARLTPLRREEVIGALAFVRRDDLSQCQSAVRIRIGKQYFSVGQNLRRKRPSSRQFRSIARRGQIHFFGPSFHDIDHFLAIDEPVTVRIFGAEIPIKIRARPCIGERYGGDHRRGQNYGRNNKQCFLFH